MTISLTHLEEHYVTHDDWILAGEPIIELRKRLAEATVAWRKNFADNVEHTHGEQILDNINMLITQLTECALGRSPNTAFDKQCLHRFVNKFLWHLLDTPEHDAPDYATTLGL